MTKRAENSGQSVSFVAEVSSNHNQDLERCLKFIDKAAAIGCDAVKFQLFRVDELFAPEILKRSEEHRRRKRWELPLEFLPELAERCYTQGVQFSCTPFYLNAVQELLPYVDFYKIASYELLWKDILVTCAKTGKPIVLSTGMANLEEVREAVNTLRTAGCMDLTLLHCVSGYPVPPAQCNLAAIQTMRDEFGCSVGWSDHSAASSVIYRAIHTWGAQMVEFHFDLEGAGAEFATGHCWLPGPIAKVINEIRSGILADGNGRKEPAPSEFSDREWRADPDDGLRPLNKMRNLPIG